MKTIVRTTAMTVVLVAIGSQLTIATNARAQCASAVKVQKADEVLIRFDMTAPPIKRIDPSYFGFNIEWPGFQADLWNSDTGQIHPDVAMWLKRLNGAIYRYPGGTVANYFKWRDAIGSNRKPQKAVDWTGPIRMDFGIEEYFRFLRAVDGKAWLVANMYGEFRNECPIDSRTTNAADFADAADKQSLSTKIPVVRWELGNELDRGTNGWSAEKYAANANSVAAAIRTVVPNTKFVAIWPDYDAYPGVPAAEYARRLSVQLDPAIDEFAQHMYFDGPTGGPPVPNRLEHMCKLIDTAKAQGKSPSVWVSEFARWPPGKPSDPNWKFSFPLTANLSAAISNADFLIGTTQIREVRGGMIHSLASSKGPWPMFHRHGEHFNPSTVMLSLVLLRQSLVGDVLPTDISSPYDSRSNNPLVRAVSVISPDKQTLWITLVNRGDTKTATQIAGTPSPLFSQMRITRIEGLHDQTELASNYEAGDRVAAASFSNQTVNLRLQSNLALDLLPNSITVLRLDRQQ